MCVDFVLFMKLECNSSALSTFHYTNSRTDMSDRSVAPFKGSPVGGECFDKNEIMMLKCYPQFLLVGNTEGLWYANYSPMDPLGSAAISPVDPLIRFV
jgi:hypothetical protein